MAKHDSHKDETSSAPIGTPTLPALALVRTSRLTRVFARTLVIAFFLALIGLAFLPWQQFVSGTGRVIAFNPFDRRVNVEARVAGRVKALHIVEGQSVKKGQLLAELEDNDPDLIANLNTQLESFRTRRKIAVERVAAIDDQIARQRLAKTQAIDGATQRVAAAKLAADNAGIQYARVAALAEKGIVSTRELELALLQKESALAGLKSAEAALGGTESGFDATIASILAQQGSASAEIASADRDIAGLEIQINQTRRQRIEAPRDGIIYQVAATDGTYLRPGSPVCVIIPETENRFVEIWVDGNDAPLIIPRTEKDGKIIPGSEARVAFAGYPAVQSIGWPNLAVGTFGGEVLFVDPTDDGAGRFRVVITEKPDIVERDGKRVEVRWPDPKRWLRQGVRTNGWVLLERVPLWFEVWRRANGFPPVITKTAEEKASAGY